MVNCPHCNESLPDVQDAFCPYCHDELEDCGEEFNEFARVPRLSRPNLRFRTSGWFRTLASDAASWPPNLVFWIFAWLGTVAAGGLFGLAYTCYSSRDAVFGLMGGCIRPVVFGVPVHFTVAVLMWVFWLSRFRIILAGFAGFLTCVSILLIDSRTNDAFLVQTVLSGLTGMLGSAFAAACYWSLGKYSSEVQHIATRRWQFTLRDLFLRVTVVSVLLAVWLALIDFVTHLPGI